VLGEAANQVSDAVVERHPEIAWRQPVLLRNRILHGYWSIDVGILRATATKTAPGLCRATSSRQVGLNDEGLA
jgi:uncharacterized protein with HEPN domain